MGLLNKVNAVRHLNYPYILVQKVTAHLNKKLIQECERRIYVTKRDF